MSGSSTSWNLDDDRPAAWVWIARAFVLMFLVWVFVKGLGNAMPHTIFSGIDLGIHEAGHLLFRPLGQFLMVAGGTILQLLAPTAAGLIFLKRKDPFGACFAVAWIGINLVEVSVYVADARAQVLPLVTVGGGEAMHDWGYLLGRLHLVQHDEAIGAFLRFAGFFLHGAAVLAGAVVTFILATKGRRRASTAVRSPGRS